MKTGVIIRSYRLTEFLARVIANYKWVDKIVVANFKFDSFPEDIDNTKEIVDSLGLSNLELISGREPISQSAVFEMAQKLLLDCDVVFISDADEFLLHSDQQRCIEILSKGPYKKIECMVTDYARADASEAYEQRTHLPVVAFKPPVKFSLNRWCDGESLHLRDMHMHHFGYCVNDYDWKLRNLWYPRHDADKITCTTKLPSTPPQELIDALAIRGF